jgi:hypothetical protein
MAKSPYVSGPILKYLQGRPNIDIHVPDMAKDLGVAPQQCFTAMSQLKTRNGVPIRTVIKGQVYRYEPGNGPEIRIPDDPTVRLPQPTRPARPSGPETPEPGNLMEVIGRPLQDGSVVLQDGDAGLWKAVRL